MTLSQKFQKNLLSTRGKKKLSQEALARKTGLSVSYVSMLERGRRSPPLKTVEAFAGALGVNAVTLLS
jgi:transcriptional regulator with XRE-family HTH domain